MSDWYYEIDGRKHGPVTIAALAAMFKNGTLPLTTMVNGPGQSEQWQPIDEVLLGDVKPVAESVPASSARPVTTGTDSEFAMWMAITPLAVFLADILVHLNGADPDGWPQGPLSSLIYSTTVFVLAILDSSRMTSLGFNPRKRWLVPFIFLSPLGYLWRRSVVTGLSYKHLWIWLICLFTHVAGSVIFFLAPEGSP